MVIFYPMIELPLLCLGIVLWILCCHYAKKRREADDWPLRPTTSPSVYVIPVYAEGWEDEEAMDQAYFQAPYRDPPMYLSGNVSPPPPYRLEPPPYPDPPPSYTQTIQLTQSNADPPSSSSSSMSNTPC